MPTNRHIAKAEVGVYANTLVDALNEQGGLDAVMAARGQLEQIIAYNRSHKELLIALSEVKSPEAIDALIKGVFGTCEPALVAVLTVVAERGDFDKLNRVWESFNEQIVQKLGVHVVDVTTAVSLDDNLREVITKKASADLGGSVVLNEHVDTSLIGGIVMSVSGKRVDASVATFLEQARATLKKSTDGGEC